MVKSSTCWLVWLHTARVFGLPMQTFVCVMGLVITALSVTGVVIWWRKHRSMHHRRERRAHTPSLEGSRPQAIGESEAPKGYGLEPETSNLDPRA